VSTNLHSSAPAALRGDSQPGNGLALLSGRRARYRPHPLLCSLLAGVLILTTSPSPAAVGLYFPGQINVFLQQPVNAIVCFDVDGDGDMEAVVGRSDGFLATVEHVGGGQFRPTEYFQLAGSIVDLEVFTDPNTRAELLGVATANPDQVVLLKHQGGAAVFEVVAQVVFDEDPGAIVAAPLGMGGAIALAVTLPGFDRWLLLEWEGGDWGVTQEVAGGDHPSSLAAIDLDGDQIPEIVTCDSGYLSQDLAIYRQDLGGHYSLTGQVACDGNPVFCAPFDEDGDLVTELLVSYADSAYVSIFEPQVGGLVEDSRLRTAFQADGLIAGEMSGGARGIWCWSTERGVLHYFRRQASDWSLLETFYTGGQARDIATCRLNGDQYLDLLVANGVSLNMALLFGNDGPSYRAYLATLLPPIPIEGLAYDEDLDGDQDLLVACLGSTTVEILRSDGTGHLVRDAMPVPLTAAPRALAMIRADGDTLRDLAVAQPSVRRVRVLQRLPGGGYTPLSEFTTGNGPFALQAIDLDGDGFEDLVVGNEGSDDITLAYGVGDGTFSQVETLPLVDAVSDVVAVDLSHDGLPEIIISNGTSRLTTLANLGGREFGLARFYNLGNAPTSMATGDFDVDGDLDLVVQKEQEGTLAYLENLGDGTMQLRVADHVLSMEPGTITTADIDVNGVVDVLVTFPADHSVGLVITGPNWTFSPVVPFISALEPSRLITGDFDKDGALDMVTLDRTLELALTMLNIEPNPVPSVPTLLEAICVAGGIRVTCVPPAGNSWWLEGETAGGWSVLVQDGTAARGTWRREGEEGVLELPTAAVALSRLAGGSDGRIAFRLRTEDGSVLALTTLTGGCTAGPDIGPSRVFRLEDPRPNPFNPRVLLGLTLERPAWVEVAVWDLAGRKVADLGRRWYPAGDHDLQWDGQGRDGVAAAGTYLLSVTVEGRTVSRKVTLLK
jgi:hypothetical protein